MGYSMNYFQNNNLFHMSNRIYQFIINNYIYYKKCKENNIYDAFSVGVV